MTHNGRCANAKGRKCVCSQCGGTEHGWQGRLELARNEPDVDRIAFRANANQAWKDTSSRKIKGESSFPRKAAGADTAVADIVDWLVEHPSTIADIERLGRGLASQIIGEVDEIPGDATERRRAMTDHFWCDLLAALASRMAEFKKLSDSLIDRVVSAIVSERSKNKKRSKIEHLAIGVAVRATANEIRKIFPPLPIDIDSTLRATRILAILLCPAPERHPAVVRHCIKPLADEAVGVITSETKQRLMEVFSQDWLSKVQKSLDIKTA